MVIKSRIFEPGKIGSMEVKNRLVMACIGNSCATEDGYITERLIDYYVERAKGGVGMIVPQAFNVSPESHILQAASIYHDQFVNGLRALTDAVHKHDTRICAQLLRRSGSPVVAFRTGRRHPVFIPSYLPFQGHTEEFKEASLKDIAQLVEDFTEATRRAKEAGFDAVEFHGCHGPVCVLSSFISPYTNRRGDKYGGTLQNRARLACEVVARSREKVGPDFPIIFRMNGSDGMEGGIKIEEAVHLAVLIEEAGVDAISVSGGTEPWVSWMSHPPYPIRRGPFVSYAASIRKAVKVPVICAARIDYSLAEEILKDGKADFIALGRPLLADPHLPNKLKEGRLEDILNCLYCNNCMPMYPRRSCTVNPSLLREKEYELRPAASAKRVIVAGGGLAGMEAARVLAKRGHKVSLYERSEKLGGQWNVVAQQENKEHFAEFTRYLSRAVYKAGVDVRLNQELTAQMVKKQQPDAVVVSTGANPATLDVPVEDGKNVIQATDLISGKAKTGTEVVVIGGRAEGMEVAHSLAKQGKKVSLITRRSLGRDLEHALYTLLRDTLIEDNVPVYQNAPVSEIMNKGVYFFYNGDLSFVKADTVVLAVGVEPDRKLAQELKQAAPDIPVYEIGDCKEPRNALAATNEAAEVARQI